MRPQNFGPPAGDFGYLSVLLWSDKIRIESTSSLGDWIPDSCLYVADWFPCHLRRPGKVSIYDGACDPGEVRLRARLLCPGRETCICPIDSSIRSFGSAVRSWIPHFMAVLGINRKNRRAEFVNVSLKALVESLTSLQCRDATGSDTAARDNR